MNRLLRPVSLIIKATEEVKKGNRNISPIAHCDRRNEIGVLSASFNSMIKRLAEYKQMQRDFINIAAHELRTPIQPILGLSAAIREEILNLGKQLQMMQRRQFTKNHTIMPPIAPSLLDLIQPADPSLVAIHRKDRLNGRCYKQKRKKAREVDQQSA
jgi:signal transduction histidine kinase